MKTVQLRRWSALALVVMLGLLVFSTTLTRTAFAASVVALNSPQVAGGIVSFKGEGFAANELVGLWVTSPEGEVSGLVPLGKADGGGEVNYSFETLGYIVGTWQLSMEGQSSKIRAVTSFELVSSLVSGPGNNPTPTPTAASSPTTPIPADAKILGETLNFNASGFQAGETVTTWTTDPAGQTQARSPVAADTDGKISYSLSTLGYLPGRWSLTFHGLTSGFEVVKSFTLVTSIPPDPGHAAPTPKPETTAVPQGGLTVTPNIGYSGQTFQITGSGFGMFEALSLWETNPLGYITKIDQVFYTDRQGNFSYTYQKYSLTVGIWGVTAHGLTSGVEKTGYLRLLSDTSVDASVSLNPTHGTSSTVITATGLNFFPNETYSYWLTAPNGSTYNGNQGTVDGNGKLSFTYTLPVSQSGVWGITVSGVTSRRQASAYFTNDGGATGPSISLSPTHGTSSTVITVTGSTFLSGQAYSYWATGPDGKVYYGGKGSTDGNGSLAFNYTLPVQQPGVWGITVNQSVDGQQVSAYFTCDEG